MQGPWQVLARRRMETIDEVRTYGSELAGQIRLARQHYQAGRTDEALQQFATASQTARGLRKARRDGRDRVDPRSILIRPKRCMPTPRPLSRRSSTSRRRVTKPPSWLCCGPGRWDKVGGRGAVGGAAPGPMSSRSSSSEAAIPGTPPASKRPGSSHWSGRRGGGLGRRHRAAGGDSSRGESVRGGPRPPGAGYVERWRAARARTGTCRRR